MNRIGVFAELLDQEFQGFFGVSEAGSIVVEAYILSGFKTNDRLIAPEVFQLEVLGTRFANDRPDIPKAGVGFPSVRERHDLLSPSVRGDYAQES